MGKLKLNVTFMWNTSKNSWLEIYDLDLFQVPRPKEEISSKFFVEIYTNNEHKLHSLLPEVNISTYSLGNQRLHKLSRCRTERCKNSFILSHVFNNKIFN